VSTTTLSSAAFTLVLVTITHVEAANEDVGAFAVYIGSMAATHYCACGRWPKSWAELRQFDDNVHSLSRSQGQAPVSRLPWESVEQSRVNMTKEQRFAVTVRLKSSLEAREVEVPVPDCSTLNPKAFTGTCVKEGTR